MSESTKKKWVPMAGAVLAVFGSFAALTYISAIALPPQRLWKATSSIRLQKPGTLPPATKRDVLQRNSEPQPAVPAADWTRTVLKRGHASRVGGVVLTYRGLDEGSGLLFETVIPDLDPDYVYSRTIPISMAKKGFQTGGERFILLSAGRSKIRLLHRLQR
jgi:hypothetical protein